MLAKTSYKKLFNDSYTKALQQFNGENLEYLKTHAAKEFLWNTLCGRYNLEKKYTNCKSKINGGEYSFEKWLTGAIIGIAMDMVNVHTLKVG